MRESHVAAGTEHVVLLGDSIFDNERYVAGGQAVIDHLRKALPAGARATLLAHDGDVAGDVPGQVARVPADATRLVLSVGGNDALGILPSLQGDARSILQVLHFLSEIQQQFQQDYGRVMSAIQARGLPCVVCTIYDAVPGLGKPLRSALSLFNDVITREALARGFRVLDLRELCDDARDYSMASPIEPSEVGGEKIAKAIARVSAES